MARRSVLVAMSGGVDSSVAAAVLVAAGYEVVGVTMKMHGAPEVRGAKHGCCTVEDADDARAVAAQLGIAHYTLDMKRAVRARSSTPSSKATPRDAHRIPASSATVT